MTTQYSINKYTQGTNGFALRFCDQIFSATLVANADTTIAVPTTGALGAPTAPVNNRFIAVISCSNAATVFMAVNAAAAVPAGGAFAATTSEIITQGWFAKDVKAGDTLHFLSRATPDITVAFYAIQE